MSTAIPYCRANRVKAVGQSFYKSDTNLRKSLNDFQRDYKDRYNGEWSCFHNIFVYCTDNVERILKIQYTYKISKVNDGTYNNCFLLNRSEFRRIIRAIKDIVPFHYRLVEDEANYILQAEVVGSCRMQKTFMMLSRMLFEVPHQIAAIDALKMKRLHHVDGVNFNKISFLNLYLICIVSSWKYSYDETFVRHPFFVPMTVNQIKEQIERFRVSSISLIYKYAYRNSRIYSHNFNMIQNNLISRIRLNSTDEIRNEDCFSRRLAQYIHNIKVANENIRTLGAHWT